MNTGLPRYQTASAISCSVAERTLIVATGVTQAPNDKEQVEPMLATLKAQAGVLGTVECLIADSGYCSEKNIKACEAADIDPLIAVARDEHHPGWRERHSEPAPLPDNATPTQAMSHRLKTRDGRARYALRKQTVEPVFGIIKSVTGFRRFSLRGFEEGHRRVDAGLHGMEFEAPGRIASTVGEMRGKPSKTGKCNDIWISCPTLRNVPARPASSPTGC